jgi:hypothetical protein
MPTRRRPAVGGAQVLREEVGMEHFTSGRFALALFAREETNRGA